MSLWKIAWRSILQRSLSSTLTGISMALGVALVIAVLVVYGVVETRFEQGAQGYHLIVGAKGGKLQLVLNTVYHLSQPIENIPYSYYREFSEKEATIADSETKEQRKGKFAAFTKVAIPYCLGDSFHHGDRSFRVVGTVPELFDKIEYGRTPDGTPQRYEFARGGRNIRSENFFEAVIGSLVARHTGLKAGDTFQPTHGIVGEGNTHRGFEIVGILEPTGTPNDSAMFVNIEGFYLLEGHAKGVPEDQAAASDDEAHADSPAEHADQPHDHHPIKPLPENQREVTSILVLFDSDLYSDLVRTKINEGPVAQAVFPAREITLLFERIVGPIQLILLVLTILIVIVAGIGIMVAIYNSMSERRHEIAVMRALGAGRTTVMAVILLESILISLAGGVLGILAGHGLIGVIGPYVLDQTGVLIHALQFDWIELTLIPALVLLASVVGFLPATAAYHTDVAKALSANP